MSIEDDVRYADLQNLIAEINERVREQKYSSKNWLIIKIPIFDARKIGTEEFLKMTKFLQKLFK